MPTIKKIPYCDVLSSSYKKGVAGGRSVRTCSGVNGIIYNQMTTSGNDPSMTKAQRYTKLINSHGRRICPDETGVAKDLNFLTGVFKKYGN